MIAERGGWTGSITWFREHVRRLRPEHHPVDSSDRLIWLAGDAAQCDVWFPPKRIPLEDPSNLSGCPHIRPSLSASFSSVADTEGYLISLVKSLADTREC